MWFRFRALSLFVALLLSSASSQVDPQQLEAENNPYRRDAYPNSGFAYPPIHPDGRPPQYPWRPRPDNPYRSLQPEDIPGLAPYPNYRLRPGGGIGSSLYALTDSVRPAWVREYGSDLAPSHDQAIDLAVDSRNNVIVTGHRSQPDGVSEWYSIKYDSLGRQLWTAPFAGIGYGPATPSTIVVDTKDNIYIAGTTYGLDYDADYTTVKYDPDGYEQWVAHFDGSSHGDDFAHVLAVDDSGNVFVSGASWFSESTFDYATLKYDPDGALLWEARSSFSNSSWLKTRITDMALDRSGNVVVTGGLWYQGGGDKYGMYATVKYDARGIELWAAEYGGDGKLEDCAKALAVDRDGNVYVTGAGVYNQITTLKYTPDGRLLWERAYGDSSTSAGSISTLAEGVAVEIDSAGDVIVAGYNVEEGPAYLDATIIKYNADGGEQWVAHYDGENEYSLDRVTDMTIDPGGAVFVTGQSSKGSKYIYATVKFNGDGSIAWIARYEGPPGYLRSSPVAIALDRSGNVYVTGSTWSTYSSRPWDYATIKYTPSGTEAWVSCYDGERVSRDIAKDIAYDHLGQVYIAGCSYTGPSRQDFLTAKYRADGVLAWVRHYNGWGRDDVASSIVVDQAGSVYVTGTTVDPVERIDFATLKYSPEGSLEWAAQFSGHAQREDNAWKLALDPLGNVYVLGDAYGPDTTQDIVIVKYDPSGHEVWTAWYDGPGRSWEFAEDFQVDSQGNVYVVGMGHGEDSDDVLWTLKLDFNGMRQWVATYTVPEQGDLSARTLRVDGRGNVIVLGSSWLNTHPVIIKYSNRGKIMSIRGGDINLLPWDMAVDDNGNMLLIGHRDWRYEIIMKLAANGILQWADSLEYVIFNSLGVDGMGNVYVGGTAHSHPINS
ncbi:MAG: SBBP repeat-containing protein, partial [Candidatus Neomarinimicrobiota bacterium]